MLQYNILHRATYFILMVYIMTALDYGLFCLATGACGACCIECVGPGPHVRGVQAGRLGCAAGSSTLPRQQSSNTLHVSVI